MELPPQPKRAARGRTGYRRHTALRVHPLILLAALIIVFGAVIFGGFYLLSAQPITLLIDGVRQDVRTHQITVGGIDLGPDTVAGVRKGYIVARFDQLLYLQGYYPILQIWLTKNYQIPGQMQDTGLGMVTPKNVEQIAKLIEQGYH